MHAYYRDTIKTMVKTAEEQLAALEIERLLILNGGLLKRDEEHRKAELERVEASRQHYFNHLRGLKEAWETLKDKDKLYEQEDLSTKID